MGPVQDAVWTFTYMPPILNECHELAAREGIVLPPGTGAFEGFSKPIRGLLQSDFLTNENRATLFGSQTEIDTQQACSGYSFVYTAGASCQLNQAAFKFSA
ncbi:hypothetical protein K470DRAFT_271620 [Piedraia hortae CBS 480.64]|uniref:Uncharacterized protein n=1 Tax=Piedraia hortae CBS 480.64 TaxID=1314780 RepID=A0A6A7BW55_9PEZI|nr:hypothetical protein K470DRAFT_271620 [Piedraia hortae CBS 480.64]